MSKKCYAVLKESGAISIMSQGKNVPQVSLIAATLSATS
jgi:hypothetical protein